jgi:serine/threonine-protein kinase
MFTGIERVGSGEEFDVARRELVPPCDPYGEGTFVGHWRVHRTLGRGGGGIVLEVSHRSSPTTRRALKIFRLPFPGDRIRWSPKQVQRFEQQFEREAELQMNVFKDPNILRVLDVGVTDDGSPYLVSDLLEGPTLDQVLRAGRFGSHADPWARPPLCQPACVWRIGRDISLALEAVHRRGFVHRDIKPANLMLSRPTGDWVAVLTDFGVAVRTGVCDPSDWGIGTPRYMAPELVSSGIPGAASRLVTTASDVYSFAIVLYELLTLTHPYAARVKELLNARDHSVAGAAERRRVVVEAYRLAQRSSNPTPARTYAPWLPQSVAQALLRALSRDPAARPPSIRDFFADLAELRDLGGGYDTVPLDRSSSLEDVEDDISTNASRTIQFGNWIDGERAASRAGSLADANVAAVQRVDRDRTPLPKVSRVRRDGTCAPTIDEKLERGAWNRRAASLAAACVAAVVVAVGGLRSHLPAPTLRPASDNEPSAPVVEAVSPPQWLMNAVTDRHSAAATAPAPSVGVGADPHRSRASPAHPAASERVKRAGDARSLAPTTQADGILTRVEGARSSAPATQADGILTRVEGFESMVDSPLPSGASDTSNDGRWVRARLIAEPDGTLGTEATSSAMPPAAMWSAAKRTR